MARPSLYLDGFDLSTLGFVCETGIQGWRDSIWQAHEYLRLPNKIAALRTTRLPQSDVRTIVVRGGIEATSVSELRDARREIYYRWAKATRVQFHDDLSIEWRVQPGGRARETPIQPEMTQDAEVVSLPFDCPDARAYDVAQTTIAAIDDTPTPVELGDAPVEVEIESAASDLTIIKRDSGGNETGRLTYAGATVGGWIVDMYREGIYDAADPMNEIAADVLVQDGGDFFSLDPIQEGNPYADPPEWPTVETDGPTAEVRYHKAWL